MEEELEYRGYIVFELPKERHDAFFMVEEELEDYIKTNITSKMIENAIDFYFSDKIFEERKNFKEKSDKDLINEFKKEKIVFIIKPEDFFKNLNNKSLQYFSDFEKNEIIKNVFQNINKTLLKNNLNEKIEVFSNSSFKL